MANISKNEVQALGTKFSIKNFISNLPNMLNNAFGILSNVIISFYDPDTKTLTAIKAEIDTINATTIITKNIRFSSSTDEIMSYEDLVAEIVNIKARLDELTN